MATKLSGEHDSPIVDINVTPFVDIILVVLIIFMVTTPIIMNPSIKINLPKAQSGEETVPSQVNLSISADGTIHLNGKSIDIEALGEKIKSDSAAKPDLQAVISADTDVPHGRVIKVIDTVKANGITKFAISIDKK